MWFVYILLCEDKSLYTGISNNIEKRFQEHQSGKGSRYTRSHKPIKIVYLEEIGTYSDALKREHAIKKWTRKAKLQRLNLFF